MVKYNYNEVIGYLEIDPQFIMEGIEYAKNEDFNSIRIRTLNQNSGQKYDIDFSPFKDELFIEKLIINDDFKIGKAHFFEALYTLRKLNHLQFRQPLNIDLSHLLQLKGLYIKGDKKVENINSLINLKNLLISSTKKDDCTHLKGLKELREFRISGAIKNLEGIESLIKLTDFKVSYSSKLTDAKSLTSLSNLEKLHLEKCKLLTDFSFLKGNTSIKELFIDNLDSLEFVATMPNLEKINFWFCKDGNMKPLLESKSLKQINFYPNKKHYTHTIEQIIELTGAQRGRNK